MLKKIKIALFDCNGFMQSLVEYLCKKKQHMVETRLYTQIEMLNQSVEHGGVDVLLACEEDLSKVEMFKEKIPQIILLSEGNFVREQSEYYKVFMYQSASAIVRDVMVQVAEDERIQYTENDISIKAGEIVCIYSPFGEIGKEQYGYQLAKEYANQQHTLYVNLELFQGLHMGIGQKKGNDTNVIRGMSEVIFYLKRRKSKLALKIETLVYASEKLDCIFTVEDFRDLQNLEIEDMEYFLQVVFSQLHYEKVVFDVGYLTEATFYLIQKCKVLYLPKAVNDFQSHKIKSFERFLQRENLESIWNQIQWIDI